MQRIPIDKIVFCHTHKQFHLSHVMASIQIAVTRADFTRTSVTDPSVTRQCNSMSTKFLLSMPKEVFTPKKFESSASDVLEHCRSIILLTMKIRREHFTLPHSNAACHQLSYWQAGKIHACVWRFNTASYKRASLKFTRFSHKIKRSDTFLTE